jgi:predicted metal-binding membrane protein
MAIQLANEYAGPRVVPRRGLPSVTSRGPAGSGVGLVLFVVVVAAWVVALLRGTDIDRDDVLGFVVAWLLMTTAVLLPSLFPVNRAHLRRLHYGTPASERFLRGVGLALGYLVAWWAFGLVAYGAWRGVGALADQDRNGAITLAVAVLILAGVYEFTPWQRAALARCRPPYPFLDAPAGVGRDLRIGLTLGATCIAASAGLAAVLVLIGVLNPGAMVGVTVAALLAKLVPQPRPVLALVGVLLVVFAVLVGFFPEWLTAV